MNKKTPPQIFNVSFYLPASDSLKNTEFEDYWHLSRRTHNRCVTKQTYTNNELRVLSEILQKLKPAHQALNNHIKTIFYKFFINILDNIQEYPDYNTFNEASTIAQLWFEFKDDLFSQKCHQYIMRQVKNSHFFDLNNSSLHSRKATEGKKNNIAIKFNSASLVKITGTHSLMEQKKQVTTPPDIFNINQVGKDSLFKFSAHIAPPSKPYLLIEGETAAYNHALTQGLISNKFANSSGELAHNKKGIPVCCLDENRNILRQIISEAGKDLSIQSNTLENTIENIKKSFSDIMKKRKNLEIFCYYRSLALIRACLILHDHGLTEDFLLEAQRLTDIAYQISYAVNKIYLDSSKKKHKSAISREDNDFCFKLADDILKHIKKIKKSIILQSGPPIKAEEKTGFSSHAFYVVLKYLEDDQLQIILVDGGSGSKYFTPVKKNNKDLQPNEYYCVAFKPISLNNSDMYLTAQNYIFSTLILPHMHGDKDTDVETDNSGNTIGPSPNCHKLLWENIFLEKDQDGQFFKGYKSEEFHGLEKVDLEQTFKRQITGNCTVHNFKQALRVATDMTALDYGRLEDNLVLGLDALIDSSALGFRT